MKYASLGLEKVFLGTLRNRWSSLLSTLQGNDKYWFLVESVKLVLLSCDGRVVKALDSKSNGVSPRRFKSCSQRSRFRCILDSWNFQIIYCRPTQHAYRKISWNAVLVFLKRVGASQLRVSEFLFIVWASVSIQSPAYPLSTRGLDHAQTYWLRWDGLLSL